MSSAVDICNLALGHLGDQAIVASIDPPDASVQAGLCAVFYPIARDAVLERHSWGFATRRKALQSISNPEQPTSWEYSYALPNLCLKPLKVLPDGYTSDSQAEAFAVETMSDGTSVLLTNTENANLLYIAKVIDTTKFSPLFIVAMSRYLASLLAGPRIKGATGMKLSQGMREFYEKVELPQAIVADASARFDTTYRDRVPSAVSARN